MTPAGGYHRFGGTNRLHLQGFPHPLPQAGQPTSRGVLPTFGPAIAPTLIRIQRLLQVLSSGHSGRVVKLTTHLHQMPILKIAGGSLDSPRPHGIHTANYILPFELQTPSRNSCVQKHTIVLCLTTLSIFMFIFNYDLG